jgi:HEAT repeat protein
MINTFLERMEVKMGEFLPQSEQTEGTQETEAPDIDCGYDLKEKEKTIQGFLKCITGKETTIRSEIIDNLLKYPDLATDALVIALLSDNRNARAMAAFALGRSKNRRLTHILINATHDESEEVRTWAVKSLGDMGDKRATVALVAALRDSSDTVRVEAAHALEILCDARSVESLLYASSMDPIETVQICAGTAVIRIEEIRRCKAEEKQLECYTLAEIMEKLEYHGDVDPPVLSLENRQISNQILYDPRSNSFPTNEESDPADKEGAEVGSLHSAPINDRDHVHTALKEANGIARCLASGDKDGESVSGEDASGVILLSTTKTATYPMIEFHQAVDSHLPFDQNKSFDETLLRQEPYKGDPTTDGQRDNQVNNKGEDLHSPPLNAAFSSYPSENLCEQQNDHPPLSTGKIEGRGLEEDAIGDSFAISDNDVAEEVSNNIPEDASEGQVGDNFNFTRNSDDDINDVVDIVSTCPPGIGMQKAELNTKPDSRSPRLEWVEKAICDDHPIVRCFAAKIAGKMDPATGIPFLFQLLNDRNEDVRDSAKSGIGGMRTKESLNLVKQVLSVSSDGENKRSSISSFLSDPQEDLQAWAVWALGEEGSADVLQDLAYSFVAGSRKVQKEAIRGIEKIGEPGIHCLIEGLNNRDPWVQTESALALINSGYSAINPLIEVFSQDEEIPCSLVSYLLCCFGDDAIASLISTLNSEDPGKRRWAGITLQQMGRNALGQLIAAGTSEKKRIRKGVLQSLGNIPDLPPDLFLPQFLSDEDLDIKRQAITLAGLSGDQRLVLHLIPLLDDDQEQIRLTCIQALEKCKNPESIIPLLKKLNDPSRRVQGAAVEALRSFGAEITR